MKVDIVNTGQRITSKPSGEQQRRPRRAGGQVGRQVRGRAESLGLDRLHQDPRGLRQIGAACQVGHAELNERDSISYW